MRHVLAEGVVEERRLHDFAEEVLVQREFVSLDEGLRGDGRPRALARVVGRVRELRVQADVRREVDAREVPEAVGARPPGAVRGRGRGEPLDFCIRKLH